MVSKKRRLVVQISPGVCEEHRLNWCARISRKWKTDQQIGRGGKIIEWRHYGGHDMRFRRLDNEASDDTNISRVAA